MPKIDRAELIKKMKMEDPNGCYSDNDATLEFGKPWSTEELQASAARLGFKTCDTCGELTAWSKIEAQIIPTFLVKPEKGIFFRLFCEDCVDNGQAKGS